uniref:B3_4 domain-containing protein n=1 Tax=Steinernema glaseri TaxID=37863 RepID=A0A1I8A6P1_9BILA
MSRKELLFWPEIAECVEKSRCEIVLQAEHIPDLLQRDPPVPDEEIQRILFHKDSPLNFVKWKGLPLRGLSADIANLSHLTQLVLEDNGLKSIPAEIGKCTNLKLVDLTRNQLTELPATMKELVHLESLILSNNQLTDSGLFDMSALIDLHVLDISNNKLDSIPESLYRLESSQLLTLLLNDNDIRTIPEGIEGFAAHLRVLNLSKNHLIPTPYVLKELHKLKTLNLTDNKFEDRRFQKLVNDKRTALPSVSIEYLAKRAPKPKAGGAQKKGKKASESEAAPPVVNGRELVVKIGVSPSVKRIDTVADVRPHIVCCILRNLNLSGDNLKKFLAVQNKIHDTLCANRTLSSIGTHDMEKFKFPLNYIAIEPADLKIHPLGRKSRVSAKELIDRLTTEAENIRKQQKRNTYSSVHKYLNLVKNYALYPCVIDAEGLVMSLAPVTNSETTKLSPNEDCNVFVEVTSGESAQHCRQVMDRLIFDTIESIGGTISVEQVKVTFEDGQLFTAYPDKNDLQGQPEVVVRREVSNP